MPTRDPDVARHIISLIDLTDLSDDHRSDGVGPLIDRARRQGTAAVCLWPEYVGRAAAELAGSPTRVATVANFPSGDSDQRAVVEEVAGSLDDGADEIDVVMPYMAILADDASRAASLVAAVADLVHQRNAVLKVILETGELHETALVSTAAQIAVDAGADFLKTSTGKTPRGASLEAFDAMIDVVLDADRLIGLKPSGGIATVAAAAEYLDLAERRLGVQATGPDRFRFGASSLLEDALEVASSPE